MGSYDTTTSTRTGSATEPMPPVDAAGLVLTQPTETERLEGYRRNFSEWGGPLSLEDYLGREEYMSQAPDLTRDGGLEFWVLTADDKTLANDGLAQRPILSSCETIRKRVLIAAPPRDGSPPTSSSSGAGSSDGESDGQPPVRDGFGYGIGSVFTWPEYRGKGYAGRMLGLLAERLRSPNAATVKSDVGLQNQRADCSALWSDIGKKFYTSKGWPAYPSWHVSFPSAPVDSSISDGTVVPPASLLTAEDLPALCEADERALRSQLARTARDTGKTAVAFAPDIVQLRWDLHRDAYIASRALGHGPSLEAWLDSAKNRGACSVDSILPSSPENAAGAIAGDPGRRVWAVWARNYGEPDPAAAANVAKNTLYIVRLCVEDEHSEASKEDLLSAFESVIQAAQRYARRWHCGSVVLWNPSGTVQELLGGMEKGYEWVERQNDSIPSLMWHEENDGEVVWVANEKYCWC